MIAYWLPPYLRITGFGLGEKDLYAGMIVILKYRTVPVRFQTFFRSM